MPDTVPLPEYPAAPDVLGLRWYETSMKSTGFGPRRLSKALANDAFLTLWEHHDGGHSMRRLGFARDRGCETILHWGKEEATTAEAVEAVRVRVETMVAAARVEAHHARERLEDAVRAHWWAVSPDRLAQARQCLRQNLMDSAHRHAAHLHADLIAEGVAKAGRAVAAARAKATAAELARCSLPEVREAVREAVRVLSLNDTDHATVRNSSGWSQATSHRGHWLDDLPELDEGLAAVGLALVHRHRRQLRPDLVATLFPRAA